MEQTLLIGGENPLFIGTAKQFAAIVDKAIEEALRRYLGGPANPGPVDMPNEVATTIVRKMLQEKGYNVKSHKALTCLLERHGVEANRKGRDNWYLTADICNIPPRK